MEYLVLKQLERNLLHTKQTNLLEGKIYGLRDGSKIFCMALHATSVETPHDPTLILPGNFEELGLFSIGPQCSVPELKPQQLGLTFEKKLSLYYKNKDESITEVNGTVIDESDIWNTFVLARLCFNKKIVCEQSEESLSNWKTKLIDDLSSTSVVKADRCKAILSLNSECSNKSIKTPVGSLAKTLNKNSVIPLCTFQLYKNKSINDSAAYAPLVRISSAKHDVLVSNIESSCVLYLPKKMPLSQATKHLIDALMKQVELACYWVDKQMNDPSLVGSLQSFHINHYLTGYVMSLLYPIDIGDSNLTDYRKQLQEALILPKSRPILRKSNVSFIFSERESTVLINVHDFVSTPVMEGGILSIVKGFYGYHHYMQDHFDDNRWGCAYRSLQTVISWFRMQGYTHKSVPNHSNIQQILVDIKDKPASFVGSKQWIGSTEVGFVLETYLNVTSRFISVNSGADLSDHGRELCRHFDRVGTPIMIGGGVLAHTIIGIQWSEDTGDIKYLILDPHYTGGENINQIVNKGWCGWKDQSFWKTNAYYNLCLPQLPNVV